MDKVLEMSHFSSGFAVGYLLKMGRTLSVLNKTLCPRGLPARRWICIYSDKNGDCQDRDRIKELASKTDLLCLGNLGRFG